MTEHQDATRPQKQISNSSFLEAAWGKQPRHTPIWFMRQAGRSLPEYRRIRGIGSILQVIKDPYLVAEITLQPVKRYNVDAAVLYSDIMVPLLGSGVQVDIVPGKGPQINSPFRVKRDLDNLRPSEIRDSITYVSEAVKVLKTELKVPLIGFAGAPFTVASYLIEGGPSKTYAKTKALMFENESLWHQLMERLVEVAYEFLSLQIAAGVDVVQIFDSWVGALSPSHYRRYVKPHSASLLERLSRFALPRIHFGVGTGELLADMTDMDLEVVGVDWRTPLSEAKARVHRNIPFQGNLDPAVLESSAKTVLSEAAQVLYSSKVCEGYIFNLGHGVPPEANPEYLSLLVEFVHANGHLIRSGEIKPSLELVEEYLK